MRLIRTPKTFLMMEKPQEFNTTLQSFLTRNKLLQA